MEETKIRGQINSFMSAYKNLRLSKSTLYLIFIPTMFFILIINILTFQQVNHLIWTNFWVTHTYQVIQATDVALYNIINLETHQRGYLITGDDQFMSEMDAEKNNLKLT